MHNPESIYVVVLMVSEVNKILATQPSFYTGVILFNQRGASVGGLFTLVSVRTLTA